MVESSTTHFKIGADPQHTIHGTIWTPGDSPSCVIQVFHGLGEHHRRYDRFARLVAARGFAVVAHDHRGHGEHTSELGFFAEENGWQQLSDDGLSVNGMIRERYPDAPIVLLGHSMGSYVAQYFAMQNADRMSALVLSASTWPSKAQLIPGKLVARIEKWRLGIHGKSTLLDKLGFGDFNKPFEPARTGLDWLSRDEAEVDIYVADPLCGGPYSCGLWLDVMGGLKAIGSDNALAQIPPGLPILLTGGADDPVGGDPGITRLAMHYAQSGHSRLTVKIYPGGRHEMFNEINRDEFSTDILNWIDEQLPTVAGT